MKNTDFKLTIYRYFKKQLNENKIKIIKDNSGKQNFSRKNISVLNDTLLGNFDADKSLSLLGAFDEIQEIELKENNYVDIFVIGKTLQQITRKSQKISYDEINPLN